MMMQIPNAIEIAKNIYWVGENDQDGYLNCNPYLILDGDEAVLIDPGSVLDFETVYRNVTSLVPLEKIKYVVLHHQDPDLCSSVPLFEKKGGKFTIVTHWRTQTLVKFYGVNSAYYIVNRNKFKLTLKSGRVLDFIETPYLHFPGAITTYDRETKVLFSSDLFGAFSTQRSLYADDSYVERMKAFHEHYMPSNEILRPVMEVFLAMDIDLIAPQHGSLIKDDIRMYIRTLRDLKCGLFLMPIKRDLSKSGGYMSICSTILGRYASLFGKEEVLIVLEGLDILLDEELNILDDDYTDRMLWNVIFDRVFAKRGLQWLIVIEPLVRNLAEEYDLLMPEVFETNLKKVEEKNLLLRKENETLKEINEKTAESLNEAVNKLTRCPVTKLYNHDFFRNYLKEEIGNLVENPIDQCPGLIVMNVDHMDSLRNTYGDLEVDEILKNIAYLLKEFKEEENLLFRLQGAWFALYSPNLTKDDLLLLAEKIRNTVTLSKKFLETISLSIGLVSYGELMDEEGASNAPDEVMYQVATKRVNIAKNRGMNIVCSSSALLENENQIGNILLVDADEANKDVLRIYIENSNCKAWSASNGEEALLLIDEQPMDLIITEVMLPQMDGFLLREKMLSQSRTKNIPFIFLSYLKDDSAIKRASMLNVLHYFKKPFMMSELTGAIDNIIERRI